MLPEVSSWSSFLKFFTVLDIYFIVSYIPVSFLIYFSSIFLYIYLYAFSLSLFSI